jgi:hypothetical protein
MAALGSVALPIAAAMMLQQQYSNTGNLIASKGGEALKGAMGERAGGKASEALGNIAGGVKPLSGQEVIGKSLQYGPFAGPVMAFERLEKLGKGIVGLPKAIEEWGEELKDSRKHLAEFNGAVAAAYAASEVRDVMRNIQSASATSGSTAAMVDAFDDLKDELQPIKNAATTVVNSIAATSARTAVCALQIAESATYMSASARAAIDISNKILEFFEGGEDKPMNHPGMEALAFIGNIKREAAEREKAERIDGE